MNKQSVIVVGDIFKKAADNKKIFTYSKVLELLSAGQLINQHLLIKQGVTEDQVKFLKDAYSFMQISSFFDNVNRCPNHLTHKVKSWNTLISEPTEVSEGEYKSILMLDENCADLSDHVTGAHLQGMVLMEAARQVTTATLEKYFIDADAKVKFVMNNFQSQFHSYVFPFDVDIHLKVVSAEGFNDRNRHVNVTVNFYQYDRHVAEVDRTVSMYDARLINYKEKTAMKTSVELLLSQGNVFVEEEVYERAA